MTFNSPGSLNCHVAYSLPVGQVGKGMLKCQHRSPCLARPPHVGQDLLSIDRRGQRPTTSSYSLHYGCPLPSEARNCNGVS